MAKSKFADWENEHDAATTAAHCTHPTCPDHYPDEFDILNAESGADREPDSNLEEIERNKCTAQ